MMNLKEIYCPIKDEMESVEETLASSLKKATNHSLLKINNYLLDSPGKRIRPALVILSAKAVFNGREQYPDDKLIKIASAIELIHMASLVHDDVIDHSPIRHSKPTVNSKWGEDVSVALGDYLYSVAFELAADCANPDLVSCVSSATKAMCEGELLQVCERGNLNLLKENYILIVKKKTATLFAASCQVGSLIFEGGRLYQDALKEYGLNFGIAFQIVDDHLDFMGDEKRLGKIPGQDIEVGEITLPLMNLFDSAPGGNSEELKNLLALKRDKDFLSKIRSKIINSDAISKTKETVLSYISQAKEGIDPLSHSPYKKSLLDLADFVIDKGFNGSPY